MRSLTLVNDTGCYNVVTLAGYDVAWEADPTRWKVLQPMATDHYEPDAGSLSHALVAD